MNAAHPSTRRYPMKTIRFARELYERGRTVTEIRAKVGQYGPTPSLATVRVWVNDDHAERERMRNRLRNRQAPRKPGESGTAFVARRIRTLRRAGLSFGSIAIVLRVDLGLEVTSEQVRYAVKSRNGTLSRRVAA